MPWQRELKSGNERSVSVSWHNSAVLNISEPENCCLFLGRLDSVIYFSLVPSHGSQAADLFLTHSLTAKGAALVTITEVRPDHVHIPQGVDIIRPLFQQTPLPDGKIR